MKLVPNSVVKKTAMTLLKGQKHAPRILFVTGITGVLTSTVMACRATLRVEDEVLVPAQRDLATIEEYRDKVTNGSGIPAQSERQRVENMAHVYVRSGLALGRLYGPSVIVMSLSVVCLTKSHNMLSKRNAALAAAYTAVSESYNEYRQRVRDELGEDKDREFRYGSEDREIAVNVNGKKTKKVEKRVAPGTPSMYARFFDEYCSSWEPDPEYNRTFLQLQQEYFNHRLHSKGYVFLNEVYKHLGMEESQAGQAVGWFLGNGDDYIDFGIYSSKREAAVDFVNGREGSILLDFNVDGVVMDLLP